MWVQELCHFDYTTLSFFLHPDCWQGASLLTALVPEERFGRCRGVSLPVVATSASIWNCFLADGTQRRRGDPNGTERLISGFCFMAIKVLLHQRGGDGGWRWRWSLQVHHLTVVLWCENKHEKPLLREGVKGWKINLMMTMARTPVNFFFQLCFLVKRFQDRGVKLSLS